jgi:phage baseplate assembly protein W
MPFLIYRERKKNMALFDFTDFYIKYKEHPKFNSTSLIEDDIVRVIVQKIEMILFTNKGEVIGDPNFGGDLIEYLHNTNVSAENVKEKLIEQIDEYIPELQIIGYELTLEFSQHPTEYSDILVINITIKEYEINAYFS